MAAIETSLVAADLPDSLGPLRAAIEAVIPVGFAQHPASVDTVTTDPVHGLFARFGQLDDAVQGLLVKAQRQVGTLGGGNHFIELCLDENGVVWVLLHSGSRHIGKTLADVHIARAKTLAHNAELPDHDLAVFLAGTPEMAAYRHDLEWAQAYAWQNRLAMLDRIMAVLRAQFPGIVFTASQPIACHHNYVAEETHFGASVLVTRKGAISARAGEWGIIPGSMGAESFIVRGLGNPGSFHSASHGAGRAMSRSAARRAFTAADLVAQTRGVECRKDADVVDEIPAAYKPIRDVMAQQADLVEVHAVLKQVLCVKG
jgi:tRNA-splicing ligase RtcB